MLLLLAPLLVACAHESNAKPFNPPATTRVETSPPVAPAGESAAPGGTEVAPVAATAKEAGKRPDQVGYATWYGPGFAGRRTASGERFDPNAMTAAHRTLPFGTWVEVRRVETGGVVRVRITDRGPWHHQERYVIDLSRAAAQRLGIVQNGSAKIELRVVDGP